MNNDIYEQAVNLVGQAVDRLGMSYEKSGSAAYRCVPDFRTFHATVMTVAEFLVNVKSCQWCGAWCDSKICACSLPCINRSVS